MKLEERLRNLERDNKELKRVQEEMSKFLKGWSDYFEKRDKKGEMRDKAIAELIEIFGSVQKIGKSKALKKFLKETNEFQERGRKASKEYVR